MKTKEFLVYWSPAIVYAGIIFWMSSLTAVPGVGPVVISDKFKHIIEFFILAVLLFWALVNTPKLAPHAYPLTILLVIFYGITDELHQYFVPGRVCDVYDAVADSCGGLLVLFRKILK